MMRQQPLISEHTVTHAFYFLSFIIFLQSTKQNFLTFWIVYSKNAIVTAVPRTFVPTCFVAQTTLSGIQKVV